MKQAYLHVLLWLIALITGCGIGNMAYSQQIKIVYPSYTSYWNTKTLIPDSVIYIAKPHTKVAGRCAEFHSDGHELNLTIDYAHSGFDIGHESPAQDNNGNKTDEYNSFSFCNVFPQKPNLNRITWLALENYVRQLASKYGSVNVKIWWSDISGHIGKDNVTVPTYCLKQLKYHDIIETYKMPNTDSVNKHLFTYYKVK